MSKFKFQIKQKQAAATPPHADPPADELLRQLLETLGEPAPEDNATVPGTDADTEETLPVIIEEEDSVETMPEIAPEPAIPLEEPEIIETADPAAMAEGTAEESAQAAEEALLSALLESSEEEIPAAVAEEPAVAPETLGEAAPEEETPPQKTLSVPAGKYGAYYRFSVRRPDRSLPPPAPDPAALAESIRGAEEYVNDLEERRKREEQEKAAALAMQAVTLPEIPEEIPEEGDADPALHTDTAEREKAKPFEVPEGYDETADAGTAGSTGSTDEFGEISRLAGEAVAKETEEAAAKAAAKDAPEESEEGGSSPLSGLDEVDVNLMEIFGMSGELREKLGTEEFERLHQDDEDHMEKVGRKEYESPEQKKEFLAGYKHRFFTTTVRLGVAAAAALIALLFECFKVVPALDTPGALTIYMLMMLQLTLVLAAAAGKEIVQGVRSLLHGKPTPELVLAVMALVNLVYELILLGTRTLYGVQTYNLPLAVCVGAALLYTKLNERRELMAFRVVSSKKRKYVITHMSSGETSLEKTAFKEYIDESSEIFGVSRTEFVDGFVRRATTPGSLTGVLGILLPAALIAAVVFFVLGYYRSDGSTLSQNFVTAVSAAHISLMFVLPACSFAVYALPFYKAASESFKAGAAIVGDGAFEEYGDASVISFNDEDVFPEGRVKMRSMRLYGKHRIDTVLYRIASVFAKLGGPLNVVFASATKDLGLSRDTEIIEVAKNGVDAAVDGEQVLIGSAAYLRSRGFTPPVAEGDEALEYKGQISILYVAVGGVMAAKLYVEYRMDPEFEGVVKALYRSGMCIGIRTLDPAIDDAMLDRRIRLSKYPVRVLKCEQKGALRTISERANSGVVSSKSVKSLLRALTYCDRTVQITKIGVAVKLLSMLGGLAIASLLFVFGKGADLGSGWAALYQLLWMLPIGLLSWFLV